MTMFSTLVTSLASDGDGLIVNPSDDWRQGRTLFGGLSAALCLAACSDWCLVCRRYVRRKSLLWPHRLAKCGLSRVCCGKASRSHLSPAIWWHRALLRFGRCSHSANHGPLLIVPPRQMRRPHPRRTCAGRFSQAGKARPLAAISSSALFAATAGWLALILVT